MSDENAIRSKKQELKTAHESPLKASKNKKLSPHWEIILTVILGFLSFSIGYSVRKYLPGDAKGILAIISLLSTVVVALISVTIKAKEKSILKRCAINVLVFTVALGCGMFTGSMGQKESQQIIPPKITDKKVTSDQPRQNIPVISKEGEEIIPKVEKEKDKSGEKKKTPEQGETKKKIATITLTEKNEGTSTETEAFSLTIFSESSAKLYLDGRFKGRTPTTIKPISLGEHIIELKAEGYKDWKDMVTIKESIPNRVITAELEQDK